VRARPSLVLVATSLAAFTATLDNTVVAVALRDVQRDLGTGVSGLQGVVTAYTVALAALLLTGGTLADVVGRRRTLLAGLVVFAGASAGCALAGSSASLIGWRAVQGAGAALVLPGALAVLAAAYPDPARRARAVGVWAATGALALVAGPLVGGLLVEARGWPWVFWVNLPLCAVVAAVALAAPAGPPPAPRRLDLPGQLLVAGGLAAATYAVVRAGRDGLGAAAVPAVVALLLLVGFALVERRTTDPVLPLGLLRERRFLGATLAAFAASLAVFVLLVFVSLFLQLVLRLEALPTAMRLLPLTAGLVVVAPLAARLAVRRGPRLPVVLGLVVAAAGVVLTAVVLGPTVGDLPLAAALAVTGVGLGLTGAPVVAESLDAVSRDRSGLAAATVNVARELGGAVAVAGLGAVVVSRLSADLTARLLGLGVAPRPAEVVVDTVLRGETSTDGVLEATGGTVPLEALLQLRAAAEASFVTSTRAALLVAAGVLLASAAVAVRTSGRSPRPS
jgi:DHA2 family methylenomycin A resistance protein-like MFS transporter